MRRLVIKLRRRAAESDGTVLLIVAFLMTALIASGAVAIDLAAGRTGEEQAQLAADASAEAAASALAGGASTAAASTTATTIAEANGVSSGNVQATYIASGPTGEPSFRVSVRNSVGTSLGKALGDNSISVSASATAAEATTVTDTTTTSTSGTDTCAAAGGECMAIFAAETGCSNTGITFGGGTTITGGAWSNSSLNIGGGGSTFGDLTYGTGCTVTPAAGIEASQNYQSNTFEGGLPVASSPLTTWPIDYATDFPSCSGSSCTGPDGTPSYCTAASTASPWTLDGYYPYTLVSGEVYCGIGSGTPSQPSTWNGTLDVNGTSTTAFATFVAGSITVGGGSALESCGYHLPDYSSSTCDAAAPSTPNYPLFYAVSGTINASSGGNGMTGDWFAPDGSISVGGGTSFIGFLEAQSVDLSSGGIEGDGPEDNGSSVGSTSTTTSQVAETITSGSALIH